MHTGAVRRYSLHLSDCLTQPMTCEVFVLIELMIH